MPEDAYLLGYREAEQRRLERQAEELGGDSARLFDEIGVREGWGVVEIGCGPRGCLRLLSERAGASGRVVGIERSADQVASARGFAAASGLANVEVREADARATGLPPGSFDLATARLVLVNVPKPEEIAAEMVRLVRPGGWVALHEPDVSTQRCDPPSPAHDRIVELLDLYASRNGIDRSIGTRAPRLLRELGVRDVRVHPLVHVYPLGHGRRFLWVDFALNVRDRIVESGLATAAELDGLTSALRRHLEDPATLVVSSVFLQVYGRVASS